MSKEEGKSVHRSEHQGGKFLPALCSVFGTLILVSVIAVCIPITVPKLMGYEIYNVVSGSMEPEIPVGSVIYVKAVSPEEVQEGDVIAFWRGSIQGADQDVYTQDADPDAAVQEDPEGGDAFAGERVVVAHRVLRNQVVEGWFETKGDANTGADMNKIPYDDLIGCVTYHIPLLGGLMALLTGTVGKMYMVCFAACGAMLNMLAARMRERNRGDLKKELEEELKGKKGVI